MTELVATLLYRAPVAEDAEALHPVLNTHRLRACGGGLGTGWENDLARLKVESGAAPLPASSFAGALASPWLGAHRGFLASMIERHGAHVTLRLTPRGEVTREAYLARLRLLHAAAAALAGRNAPMAIFWQPSNQCLTGAQYAALCGVEAPFALFMHPVPLPLGQDPAGEPLTGLRLNHAEEIIGRKVELGASALPRVDQLRLAIGFVQHCVETGRIPAPGTIVGTKASGQVEVTGPAEGAITLLPRGAARAPAAPRPRSRARDAVTMPRWAAALAAGSLAVIVAMAVALAPVLDAGDAGSLAASEILEIRKVPVVALP